MSGPALTTKELELDVRLETVEFQRNRALSDHARAEGRAAVLKQQNDILTAKLAAVVARATELAGQIAELSKPKEA